MTSEKISITRNGQPSFRDDSASSSDKPGGSMESPHAVPVRETEFVTTVRVENNSDPGAEREIWLAPRSDGKPGRGTRSDPCNASTPERFDAILGAIGNRPVTIRLTPGEFHVRHTHPGWHVRNGWHLRGAGMGRTIVKIVEPDNSNHGYWWTTGNAGFLEGDPDDYCHFGTVGHLTIDGGQTVAAPGRKINAIGLRGGRLTVERVEVIRCGGAGGEVFPITLGNDWRLGKPCHLNVRDCVVRDTAAAATGATAIMFAGANPGTTAHGTNRKQFAQALNNKVIHGGCLGVANFCNWEFVGNDVDMTRFPGGSAACFNADTGHCARGLIERNTFRGAHYQYAASGVVVIGGNNGVFKNIRIVRNRLHTLKNGHGYGAVKLQGNTNKIEVIENICEVEGALTGGWLGIFQTGKGNKGLRRRGNRMENGDITPNIADT